MGHAGSDCGPISRRAARIPARALVSLALVVAACGSGALTTLARADAPHSAAPIDARVVWVRGTSVYVAATDSLVLGAGDRAHFVLKQKTLASGEVARVVDRGLALVTLDSGSLDKTKHLDKVRVLAEHPARRAPALLRIGYPSERRPNLLFACASTSIAAPGTYRADPGDPTARRLVRDPASGGAWPETLLAHPFDDADDEEIALERGELDVALFWPGEPSTHLRSASRGQGLPVGRRSRGAVAAIDAGPATRAALDAGSVRAALARLDAELFRDDLLPWAGPADSGAATAALRVAVDATCPGRAVLERFFDRDAPHVPGNPATVRMFYLDAPAASADSLALAAARYVRGGDFPAALRARAEAIERLAGASPPPEAGALGRMASDSLRVTWVFAIGCPVASTASARPAVDALGAGALVDLLQCALPERRP